MQPGAVQEPKTWIMQTLLFNLKNALEYLKNAAQGAPGAQNLDHANPVVQSKLAAPVAGPIATRTSQEQRFCWRGPHFLAAPVARHIANLDEMPTIYRLRRASSDALDQSAHKEKNECILSRLEHIQPRPIRPD